MVHLLRALKAFDDHLAWHCNFAETGLPVGFLAVPELALFPVVRTIWYPSLVLIAT